MNLDCLKCAKPMRLLREAVSNYAWQCPDLCLPPVDTGVPVTEDISGFEKELTIYAPHNLVIRPPLAANRIAGAKVYAPHILIHFIECTWGGCYNSIYENFLLPHFDSAKALDYALRSPVVRSEIVVEDGIPALKMYPELLSRLRNIRSANIKKYLAERFGT